MVGDEADGHADPSVTPRRQRDEVLLELRAGHGSGCVRRTGSSRTTLEPRPARSATRRAVSRSCRSYVGLDTRAGRLWALNTTCTRSRYPPASDEASCTRAATPDEAGPVV